jgi:methylated-DNA-protein-cysteine methyltransferase-like protein
LSNLGNLLSALRYFTSLNTFPAFLSWLTCSTRFTISRLLRTTAETMSWNVVYDLVKQIPRGRVLSYGGLAKALRLPGGARTAGRAMAATPSGKGIPWHRVVGERGKILIREPYASLQKKLLESEGVPVVESRVNFRVHSWAVPRKLLAGNVKSKASGARTRGRR